ncbi:MAG: hypothetical protein CL947_02090 [Epsilonproteobacteria bacterium]|nr:hypothetical protein [Campylobacterota bacterium]|tara:strand:- start:5323 stop:5973 length:651 start_codon:yes stop_codon:yes gene_type:complete
MIQIIEAHCLSTMLVIFTALITPMYWFLALPYNKAIIISWLTALLGSSIFTLSIYYGTTIKNPAIFTYILAATWFIPLCIIWFHRQWFSNLNQRVLAGFQIFRLLSVVFYIEMYAGHISSQFAIPAGGGDTLVGLFALYIVYHYKKLPTWAIKTLLIFGAGDIVWSYFAMPGPLQLFALAQSYEVAVFPFVFVGMFLVPSFLTFHLLSYINLVQKK